MLRYMSGNKAAPVPVTLVIGEEELLADRAVAQAVAEARAIDPETEVHELPGGALAPGVLHEMAAPSLFGGRRVIVVRRLEDVPKQVVSELTAYLADPPPDVAFVVEHSGGAKAKPLADSVKKAGAQVVTCPKITKYGDRIDFVRAEIRGAGSRITEDAARSLLDAVGNDLRELAGACSQLVSDTDGTVDAAAVARYHRGHAEVTGFAVADRALEGRRAAALEQLRWALATGVSPVLITSALAQGLRAMTRVSASRHLQPQEAAREAGMPVWKVRQVLKQQLPRWSSEGVARALRAVAEADAEVKGGGADPGYALERAILVITAATDRGPAGG